MGLAASLETQPLSGLYLGAYVTVSPDASVCGAVAAMNGAETACAIVVDDGAVIGVFTDRDVLMRVAAHPETWDVSVEAVMTADPAVLAEADSAAAALATMTELRIRNVPVLRGDGSLAGNASYGTIMCLTADILEKLTAGDITQPTTESGLLFIDFTGLTPHKPVTAKADSSMADAVRQMQARAVGSLLVVDDREHLIGVMTEYDVQTKFVCTDADPAAVPIRDYMTDHPVALSPRDPIAAAVRRMAEHGFTHVPLVADTGRPVGMVSFRDIADFLETSLETLR